LIGYRINLVRFNVINYFLHRRRVQQVTLVQCHSLLLDMPPNPPEVVNAGVPVQNVDFCLLLQKDVTEVGT
jgi:hypothetical protein